MKTFFVHRGRPTDVFYARRARCSLSHRVLDDLVLLSELTRNRAVVQWSAVSRGINFQITPLVLSCYLLNRHDRGAEHDLKNLAARYRH